MKTFTRTRIRIEQASRTAPIRKGSSNQSARHLIVIGVVQVCTWQNGRKLQGVWRWLLFNIPYTIKLPDEITLHYLTSQKNVHYPFLFQKIQPFTCTTRDFQQMSVKKIPSSRVFSRLAICYYIMAFNVHIHFQEF